MAQLRTPRPVKDDLHRSVECFAVAGLRYMGEGPDEHEHFVRRGVRSNGPGDLGASEHLPDRGGWKLREDLVRRLRRADAP